MTEALLVVVALGVLMGGSVIVIDSLIVRRLRRRQGSDQDDLQR